MAASQIWTIAINRPPEDVWPLVGDLDRHHEWSPKPYRVEWLSGEPNAVGSRLRSIGWLPQDKEHVMEGSITANEPGKVLEVTTADKGGEWTNRYEVAPAGAGTIVTKTRIAPPMSGVKKAVFSVVNAVFITQAVQKGMELLKSRAEAA
jgi:uncharacterized protein YndB with AHSA1/START domain